jgi:internalin A
MLKEIEGGDPHQEAMRRIREAAATGAQELDLSGLGLGVILRGKWDGWSALRELGAVWSLNLNDNQITHLPDEGWIALSEMNSLTHLHLSENQIEAIDGRGWFALGQCASLESLDLMDNNLQQIPEEGWDALRRMSQLTHLYLSDNRISELPITGWRTLGELKSLKSLFISRNQLTIPKEGWEELGRLTNLQSLALSSLSSRLSAAAWIALGGMNKLQYLGLGSIKIGTIPKRGWKALRSLTSLETLLLSDCNLESVPDSGWEVLGSLSTLEKLYLRSNRIGDITSEGWNALGRLRNLRELDLRRCEIKIIPANGWHELSRLPRLQVLNLSVNQIDSVPLDAWVTRNPFPILRELDLSNNPLPEDLLAAATRGPKSLFEYLEASYLRAAHPRTVKLMLLGEPASGKTTLVEALRGNPTPCDPDRPETIGINIQRVAKKSALDERTLYLSTWDFAGQHMEYATHQFFLRPGAVYLIVWKARLGSDYGQRDLWYWLELLQMRVKEPEFLLVTTNASKTPAGLNLNQVYSSYPGCRGHFEVDLCDGTGVAALEAKILELAEASPSMKAVWPAPWLAVRDRIRDLRGGSPYVSAEAFWKLCVEFEVTGARAQRDLADQLDKLGEIVYYANEPLSRFVVLDPTWLTELVAKVVRDKSVRDQGGTLNSGDLDRLWGDLPGVVRDHLENLMDEYDLVYKTAVHQRTRSSIVVEALPPAPNDVRSMDIAAGRPQTEVIYRFPTMVRHLPPGVPTWAFARSRRHMKLGAGPWRDAALFEDRETNSAAIVLSSEVNREVRLRVAADYPPYFLGVLDSILRDTFKRYPGAQPETRIPCPCQPDCKYSYLRDTVFKRSRAGKTDVGCELTGEDVSIGRLLEGFAPGESEAGVRAALADVRRRLSAIQNGQNEELVKTCPSVFTLAPTRDFRLLDTYPEYAIQQEELELTLYCEWEKEWHPTQHSVYRFRPVQEWVNSLKEKWGEFSRMTKRVAPLVAFAGTLVGVPAVGVAVKSLADRLEKPSTESEKDKSGQLARDVGLREHSGAIDLDTRHLLMSLIEHLDKARGQAHPRFGGLTPYHSKEDGRILWLCPDHRRQYENIR